MDKKKTRRDYPPIKVYVLPDERTEIEARAQQARMSNSTYLRQLGQGYEPASTVDHEAVLELIRAKGELGRLGGLLKMWLTNDERLDNERITPDSLARFVGELEDGAKALLKIATDIRK